MRHSDIKTTLEYYVDDDAEATADVLWQAVQNSDVSGANTFADT